MLKELTIFLFLLRFFHSTKSPWTHKLISIPSPIKRKIQKQNHTTLNLTMRQNWISLRKENVERITNQNIKTIINQNFADTAITANQTGLYITLSKKRCGGEGGEGRVERLALFVGFSPLPYMSLRPLKKLALGIMSANPRHSWNSLNVEVMWHRVFSYQNLLRSILVFFSLFHE